MSNNNRWDVDTTLCPHPPGRNQLDNAMVWLLNTQVNGEDAILRDFIIELVHEIERLQTENIKQQVILDNCHKWLQPLTDIWDNETDAIYDRPNPQPFHMEPEK